MSVEFDVRHFLGRFAQWLPRCLALLMPGSSSALGLLLPRRDGALRDWLPLGSSVLFVKCTFFWDEMGRGSDGVLSEDEVNCNSCSVRGSCH